MSQWSKNGTVEVGAFDAVIFDLLTALIDSWTLWNDIAGSPEAGLAWRQEYLKRTYGEGAYRAYETIVTEAACATALGPAHAEELLARWHQLAAWPEVTDVLSGLNRKVKLAVVTNCSRQLGRAAARATYPGFTVITTAEEAGAYKPRPEPYLHALRALGTLPERTLFVAGSAADVPGASGCGMTVYWHNRMGLAPVDAVRADYTERDLLRLSELI